MTGVTCALQLCSQKKRGVGDDKVHINQLENCQARYRSNTWMGRTRTDGPDEFEPSKFDCYYSLDTEYLELHLLITKKAFIFFQVINCVSANQECVKDIAASEVLGYLLIAVQSLQSCEYQIISLYFYTVIIIL